MNENSSDISEVYLLIFIGQETSLKIERPMEETPTYESSILTAVHMIVDGQQVPGK